jgi:hypothetical protein
MSTPTTRRADWRYGRACAGADKREGLQEPELVIIPSSYRFIINVDGLHSGA